jgi:hypothetical protein
MFLDAGEPVLRELAEYVRTGKGKTPRFWDFVNSNLHLLEKAATRPLRLRARGAHHDLEEIFNKLNNEYFGGVLSSAITWGSRGRRRARSRTLGSYHRSTDLIRINPVLDSRRVPRYYVEFVIYHEMLHADIVREGGRVHTPEFRQREREFRDYARAIAWEGRN